MHIPHLCSVIRKLIGTLPKTFPDSTNKMTTTNSSQEYLTSTNNLSKINSLVQGISTDPDVLECVIKDLMESNDDYSLEEVVDEYMGAIEEDLLVIKEAMKERVAEMILSGFYDDDEEEEEED